eukprot:303662_1
MSLLNTGFTVLNGIIQPSGSFENKPTAYNPEQFRYGPIDNGHKKPEQTFKMKCECGKKMRLFKCEVIQNLGEYNKGIKCKKCRRKVDKNDWMYHCDGDNNKYHPKGNNICAKCVQIMMTDITVLKHGFMQKRGKLNKSFQKRYFQLQNDKKLIYYKKMANKNNKNASKCGLADFQQYPITSISKVNKIEFHIETEQRTWIFCCQTGTERDEWYDAIKSICTR